MPEAPQLNLSEWVEEYTNDMYSWAFHKVSDPELAKDLVQDTFLAAAAKLEGFKGDSSPKSWLYSILNHKIIDHYRKKVREPVKMDNQVFSTFFDEGEHWRNDKAPRQWHEEEEGHLLDNTDFLGVLEECLDALPEKWGTSVKLKYLMNKNGEEICQELDISPTNFWQIVHRAKMQLRSCVEENWFVREEV